MTINFTGWHFPSEIILQSVRYYLAYKLSYREIEEILAERGIIVDHSTLNWWVIKYVPLLEHQARQIKKPIAASWRMDETYSVPGVQGEHGSLNEPRVYLKYTSTIAGTNLCRACCSCLWSEK